MHKTKGKQASLASQRTARERKKHQQEKEGMKPAVQAKTDYTRNKRQQALPVQEEARHIPLRHVRPIGFGGINPLAACMALMAAGARAGPSLQMLDTLFGENRQPSNGPIVLELDVTGDLSSLRSTFAALRGKPVATFLRHEGPQVPRLDSFLELVEQINMLNPIPEEDGGDEVE